MGSKKAPYGTWKSPVSPRMLAGDLRLNNVMWDSDGQTVVWSENRGQHGVLVAKSGAKAIRDLTDSSYNVKGRVGYGGGEFTVAHGHVFFISSGRLHKLPLAGGQPQVLTPKFGGAASPCVSPDGGWVAFVHTYEDEDVLGVVDTEGKQWPQKIAAGDDFYMQPAWHPDGLKIAYIAWNFPQMPFNGTELRLLTLKYDGRGVPHPAEEKTIAGDTETAIFQPEFSPDGRFLSYISDESGWGHLYLYEFETNSVHQITGGEVEHGTPAWVQGLRTYAWTQDGRAIYYIRQEKGFSTTWVYDLDQESALRVHELNAYTSMEQIAVSPADESVALLASSSTIPPRVIRYSAQSGVEVVRRATSETLPKSYCPGTQAITWKGHDGENAHGLYYAPQNPKYDGTGVPPLVVLVHGGPTSHRTAAYDANVLFFTSRGYAVLQVNHRGSTGYGKAYMNKHAGNWGVYDVQDSITGAQHLVKQGLADEERLVIMGGSAGGYTVLQTLVDAPGVFKASVCLFGVASHFSLAMDTHKFESRYEDWLLGPLPEASEKYRDRSPIFHAEKIKDAMIVYQGADDVVVPQNQSDMIVDALKRNGVPHEYHVYEGEGHGFKKPETKIHFYESLERFLLHHVIYA